MIYNKIQHLDYD